MNVSNCANQPFAQRRHGRLVSAVSGRFYRCRQAPAFAKKRCIIAGGGLGNCTGSNVFEDDPCARSLANEASASRPF